MVLRGPQDPCTDLDLRPDVDLDAPVGSCCCVDLEIGLRPDVDPWTERGS
jgi:hypothetical protein